MMPERALQRAAFVALLALASLTFMGKAYENSLQALDSTTHAMLAIEVTQGDLTPKLPMRNFVTNLKTNPEFNDHPFTLFYLSGLAMKALGPSAFSARLVPTAFSVGCVLLVAILGSMFYSPAVGLIAGLVLMTTRDFIMIGSRFHLDTAMVFFILLSFIAWSKKRWALAGISVGMGLWMKTPVSFLLYPAALLAMMVSRTFSLSEFRKLFLSGLIAVFTGSLIWILTGYLGGWHLVTDYWTRQVWGTAVGGRGAGLGSDYYLGWQLLRDHYLPWLYLLIPSLGYAVWKRRWQSREWALAFSAVLILELVLGTVRFKFYWYYIPVYPFLALLLVDPARNFFERNAKRVYLFFIFAGLILPTVLLITPIELGPENFPALRRFEPIIQNYGSTDDHIMFVDGGQPYGSDLDTIYELSFYTGRKIIEANCENSNQLLKQFKPEWIIITAPNASHCLEVEVKKQYSVQYKFGRQFLFTRIVSPEQATDLTPLIRELKPLNRGKLAPFPDDPYFPREQ
jgi:4-amino-4-deoxy-L-arabinose transferase-like glycosyltransferase